MPRCEAEKAAERIRDNKTITDLEILQIEVFLRMCISNCTSLNKTLNKYLADKKRGQDTINDPTIQEESKKAWWKF
jgi:hypothetical protein